MKKILTFLSGCLMSVAAQAATNGICEVLPAGNPTYAFYEARISGSTTRPNNFTFTVPEGLKRGLFVVFMEENNGNNGDYPTSITYGGQAMTESANSVSMTNSSVQKFLNVRVFFLGEEGIRAASSNSFNVSYYASTPKNNASYCYTIFAVDEAKQQTPIVLCGAQQTGGNLNRPDSISCSSPSSFNTGDLFLCVGAAGHTGAGPLHSNCNTSLVNKVSNGMVGCVFYKSLTASTTLTPYLTTNGTNAGRFSMLALQVQASATVTLPIQLESFSGQAQQSANALRWTAMEKDLNAYEVERSTDGKAFYNIGTIKARTEGADMSRQDYSFTDQAPLPKSYYRLHITQNDGSSTYSDVVGIANSDASTTNTSVYPNPSNGAFTIAGPAGADMQITIYNAFGQRVGYDLIGDNPYTNQRRIQLQQATPGYYYVSWMSNGKSASCKMLVQ